MDSATDQSNRRKATAPPVTAWLHPSVYTALMGLALWFVIAVWSFAGAGETDYLLFIVSGFVFVAVALPFILSRVRRAHDVSNGGATRDDHKPRSFRDWTRCDFDTWQGRLSGTEAVMQILLPIAAAALGMTAIGIVFYIIEHGQNVAS